MRTLCVILGRAGSKGLPGKNAASLRGRPMIGYTLDHALGSAEPDRVVVSTDGEAIAEAARSRGGTVIDRPAELAHDTASVDAAVRHAVEAVEAEEGASYEAVVILYANVPLRPADLTDRAVRKLADSGCDSVQSVAPVGKGHPYWMKRLGGDAGDAIEPWQPNRVYRRQDLPPAYMLDGGLIAVRRSSLFHVVEGAPHAFLGRDQRAVVTGPGEVVDVDTATDLALAEALLDRRGGSSGEGDTSERRSFGPGGPGSSSASAGSMPSTGRQAAGGALSSERCSSGSAPIAIGGRAVGPGEPVYVIAELGVNHDGSADRAVALTEAAARAGADAVKLQLFEPRRLLSAEARLAAYQEAGEEDPFAMLERLQLDADGMRRVREAAHERGLGFVVTCFSVEHEPLMRELGVDAVKIASPDCVNLPLIEAMLGLDRPVLISTGAADLAELGRTFELAAGRAVRFMQCVSSYPAELGDAALGGIRTLAEASGAGWAGYSDHTTGVETGGLATAAEARVIEKHLTHDRAAAGPDHAASLDPEGFAEYVWNIRRAEAAVGSTGPEAKAVQACERDVRRVARQSVCAVRDLKRGEVLERADLTVKRPGTGLPAARLHEAVGCTLRRDVPADHPLPVDAVDPSAG